MSRPNTTIFVVHSPDGPLHDNDMTPKLRALKRWAGRTNVTKAMTHVPPDATESADWELTVHRVLTGDETDEFIKVLRREGFTCSEVK